MNRKYPSEYRVGKIYIALTFDDGFVSHFHCALLLARKGIRATFFIPTHERRWRTLAQRPELIQEIAKMGHEIGSHSKYHLNLATQPPDRVEENLRVSKTFLEDVTGMEVLGFAYPYGSYSARVIARVMKYYHYARGSMIYPWEDPLNLGLLNKHNVISRYTLTGIGFSYNTVGTILSRIIKFRMVRRTLTKLVRTRPQAFVILVFHRPDKFMLFYYHLLDKLMSIAKFVTIHGLVEEIDTGV